MYSIEDFKEEGAVKHYHNENLPIVYLVEAGQYKASFCLFTESTITSTFWLGHQDISIGLLFKKCQFNGSVIFDNVSAKGYNNQLNKDSQNLVFKNCTFKGPVIFRGESGSFERDILFEDCVFEQGLNVQYLEITAGSFSLRNCTINEQLDLFNIKTKQDVRLEANTVKTHTRFTNLETDTLLFTDNNVFEEKIHIYNVNARLSISINNGNFKKEVKLLNCVSPKGYIMLFGPVFEQSVYIKYELANDATMAETGSFYFEDCQFTNGLYVNETKEKSAKQVTVTQIEFEASASLKGDYYFGNMRVNALILRGNNASANLMFENIRIESCRINRFINSAGLIFKSIQTVNVDQPFLSRNRFGILEITDSNLGKAQFFDVHFSRFEKIYLENNILSEISFSMVQWFTETQLAGARQLGNGEQSRLVVSAPNTGFTYLNSRTVYEQGRLHYQLQCRQDLYRQLKIAAQRQGDIPQSLEFQRHEMNFYRKTLKLKSPGGFKEWVTLLGERAILGLNQTNDFGQNWLKALALLLLFSFIFYMPIGFLTSPRLHYGQWANSLSDISANLKVIFWDNLKTWMVTLNPAHRINDLATNMEKYTPWLYFWDMISRVVVAYFIFQTISAFRKFNK